MAPIGLIVALPQLVLGSVVALFLYRKWVDARFVFAGGLLLIALACFSGAQLTSDWNRDQFVIAQTLQAFGQPMAEIGRASCRERVCQYVSIPVVAVPLKKKQNKD